MTIHASSPSEDAIATTARQIGQQAGELFRSRTVWCSTAVLITVNEQLNGQLPRDMAISIASGLGEGISGAGCTCGALSGGVLTLGLFLGSGQLGLGSTSATMKAGRQLHDRFISAYGSTCCRVLTKSLVSGSNQHFDQCARHTASCAQWASELILQQQPAWVDRVQPDAPIPKKHALWSRLKKLFTGF